jgi:hypothetical protein
MARTYDFDQYLLHELLALWNGGNQPRKNVDYRGVFCMAACGSARWQGSWAIRGPERQSSDSLMMTGIDAALILFPCPRGSAMAAPVDHRRQIHHRRNHHHHDSLIKPGHLAG